MILPGTLVQYVRNRPGSVLRPFGIYTVIKAHMRDPHITCFYGEDHDFPIVHLAGVGRGPTTINHNGCRIHLVPGFCMCSFRILAGPLETLLENKAPEPVEG